ncbi:MAG: hypothetical protein LBI05_00175 [Planctomycetaceae bacterium]|jgi:hypothetical protein|nr:hypothetical protein [Planctomycetaceae bacterium]
MIENVKLTGRNQTIEIDRTKTTNYVLETVNLGEKDTAYSTIRTNEIIGLERDIWYKQISNIEIVGWVIADSRDAESMERRKMRFNHFVIPNTQLKMVYDGINKIDIFVTESIRYGKSHAENNDAFCKFQITGVYRR